MELQSLTNLLLAMTIAHTLHSFGEVRNIREKVKRLEAYISKKPYKEIPISINTRLKAISLGYVLVIVMFIISFVIVIFINPPVWVAVWLSLSLIVTIELVNTVTIDAYHVDIEKVTKPFKN